MQYNPTLPSRQERSIAPGETVKITTSETIGYPGKRAIGLSQLLFKHMNIPRNDKALSHVYREGAWPEPNRQIEQAIRATERERRSFARRWAPTVVLAAGAVLALVLILRLAPDEPPLSASPAPAASSAKTEPTPAAAEPRKAPAEAKSPPASAQAPVKPSPIVIPPYAMRRDEAERRGLLPPDTGLKANPPVKESAKPPPAPRTALKKEPPPERVPDPQTFVPTRSPQAWIEDIRRLKADGKTGEAALELAEFRARYADYVLPEDLR